MNASTDPILPMLSEWRAVNSRFLAWHASLKAFEAALESQGAADTREAQERLMALEEANEPACEQRSTVLSRLYETIPTTLAGLAGLVEVFMEEDLSEVDGLAGAAVGTICRAVLALRTGIGVQAAA